MKINKISQNIKILQSKRIIKNQKDYANPQKLYTNSYPKEFYINFTGGKSLDLRQTYEQIKKFGAFPNEIEEEIQQELKNGNKENLTLIDVHKAHYSLLNECKSLDDAKALYPEFKDVLSDNEVKYNKSGFIDNFKQGKFEILDPNEDLSLQLLQLYWAEGFSIRDLDEKLGNSEVLNAMRKLQIPRMDKIYAKYLKFSDKDYNERLSKTLSEKLKGKTHQYRNIDRKPMSEETKQKISDSLIKYYQQNPHVIFDRNSDKKEYTDVEIEMFRQVALRAWNYHEAESIKKSLSKFMKRKSLTSQDLVDMTIQDKKKNDDIAKYANRRLLKDYWNKNSWAKKIFSQCMQKSWARQKELEEYGIITEPTVLIKYIPTGMHEELCKHYPKEEVDSVLNFQFYGIFSKNPVVFDREQEGQERFRLFKKYLDTNNIADRWNLSLEYSNLVFANHVAKQGLKEEFTKIAEIIVKNMEQPNQGFFEILKQNIVSANISKKYNEIIETSWEKSNDKYAYNTVLNEFESNIRKYAQSSPMYMANLVDELHEQMNSKLF